MYPFNATFCVRDRSKINQYSRSVIVVVELAFTVEIFDMCLLEIGCFCMYIEGAKTEKTGTIWPEYFLLGIWLRYLTIQRTPEYMYSFIHLKNGSKAVVRNRRSHWTISHISSAHVSTSRVRHHIISARAAVIRLSLLCRICYVLWRCDRPMNLHIP